MMVRWVRAEKRGLAGEGDLGWQRTFSRTSKGPSHWQPLTLHQAGMRDQIWWGESGGGMKKSVRGGTFGPGRRWEGTGRVGWRAHPCSSSKILGRDRGVLRWKGRSDRQAREEPSDALTLQLHSHTSRNWMHTQVCRLGFCLIYMGLWVFSRCEHESWCTVHARKPLLPIFVNTSGQILPLTVHVS